MQSFVDNPTNEDLLMQILCNKCFSSKQLKCINSETQNWQYKWNICLLITTAPFNKMQPIIIVIILLLFNIYKCQIKTLCNSESDNYTNFKP